MTESLLIRHARIATMDAEQTDGDPLALREDFAVLCAGGRIAWLGPTAGAPPADLVLEANGALLTPGFVDPHTHLVFAGDRAGEHAQRLAGASYLAIAAAGGGIASTVRTTRAASDADLLRGARGRLARMLRAGVTTVEVKSGYGLSVEEELRLLRLSREAGEGSGVAVIPTLLALHAVPPGVTREAWVEQVLGELLPEAVRQGLAVGCDAFCEQGAFTASECHAVLSAAARAGLTGHLHADQLTPGHGAELAASLSCASADHLERTTPAGAAALARAGTTAVLLPLAAWFLREKEPAQAAPFLAAGASVALGSNLNPGSQRLESVSLLLAAGCLLAGLTPAQALWACTQGGARALRLADRGRLALGLRADLVLFATKDPAHLPYHAGLEHAQLVVSQGRIVHDSRSESLNCS